MRNVRFRLPLRTRTQAHVRTFVEFELTVIVAPIVLGGGKRSFEGFTKSLELEHIGLRWSPFATFIDYRVKRS